MKIKVNAICGIGDEPSAVQDQVERIAREVGVTASLHRLNYSLFSSTYQVTVHGDLPITFASGIRQLPGVQILVP